jgi:5-methylcytosine-specific restriction enzyme subunit McrC
METTIPIHNLYYLLCYAWDRLDERDLLDVSADTPPRDTLNLLGRVLSNGVRALIRRGFERGYIERQEELTGLRGKIAVGPTAQRQLARYGRAECLFDELEHDTPANRVIRATLGALARSPFSESSLRHESICLTRHFRDVRLIRATVDDCRRMVIHRNNRHYGFLIELCALILGMVLPNENGAETCFRDFARDHRAMAVLFERFVRNFYIHHADEAALTEIGKQTIPWAGQTEPGLHQALWPGMEADICLRRVAAPPLVIDCKFYTDALKENQHGQERLSSANLYQIFTYAQNLAHRQGWEEVEGLLLYAQTGDSFDVTRSVCGRHLRAATVNLDRPWPEIHDRLIIVARG